MKFEIIKNSESHTGYQISDNIYKGQQSGLCSGWQYEFINDDGEYGYGSVVWTENTPEEYAYLWTEDDGTPWIESGVKVGYKLTGRVIFRGYAKEYYDAEDHETYVKEVPDDQIPDPTPIKEKRIWTEEEIKNLIQTNDKVLYAAFKKLYACQTDDEQNVGETHHVNGVGFNGVDAPILSSMAEFLIKTGFLTPKQKVIVRKKLVKYNKQLTKLANA